MNKHFPLPTSHFPLKMRNIFLISLILLIFACSDEGKTDKELLERDKKSLKESLDSYKITTYKFGKIIVRASAEKDTISPEFQSFKSDFDRLFNKVVKYSNNQESLSVLDYISIYRDYKKMEDFITKTDEDIFPTLTDAFNLAFGDSTAIKGEYLEGVQKIYVQNIEHAILSSMVILSKNLGKEISLYECSKTYPKLLPDSEIKTLLQFFRGFLFFEKGLFYLSEDEISRNIDWLNKNKRVNLPYTRAVFQWGNLNNEQTHLGFHSFNHLFRGFDRLMMERKIDEKRALEDFEMFLKDAKEMGLDNELVWSVETYLYLKHEENEKAIAALSKLKTSALLSSNDKERIDESIEYLQNRKAGKVLNSLFDKIFLSKLATKYMLSILSQVDWKKILKEQNVPYIEEIFKTIDNFNYFAENLDKYSSAENLKNAGEEIKSKGESLWNKAKELTE